MDAIDIARFWSKVEVGSIHKCWPWRGAKDKMGYGAFKMPGKRIGAHRIAFEIVFGQPADGLLVRHRCDNPSCCNPYHLTNGSHADNVADRVMRDRSARGIRNGRAKLSETEVRMIRSDTRTTTAVARDFGVSQATISNIITRRTWSHLED